MGIFAAMSESTLPIHFAQLQSYTNVIYRLAHARIFSGIETYCSSLVCMEHGENTQLLTKMKSFWEHLLPGGNRKV